MTEATITQRFFEDGTYYSQYNMASLIKSLLTSGYLPQFGDGLVVNATNPATMSVTVGTGMGVLEGYIVEVEGGVVTLTLDNADPTNARIDRIVARLKPSASPRGITFAVIKGTPSGTPIEPELTRTSSVWELPLACVAVRAGVAVISQSDITDERVPAYNNASGLPALPKASGDKYGVVKIGSGVTVNNGVISVSTPFPMHAKATLTDRGLGYLIKNNEYMGTLGFDPLGVVIQNKGDVFTKNSDVSVRVKNHVSGSNRVSVSFSAINVFTGESRVYHTETHDLYGTSGTSAFRRVEQISWNELCNAYISDEGGGASIQSKTYTMDTVYLEPV